MVDPLLVGRSHPADLPKLRGPDRNADAPSVARPAPPVMAPQPAQHGYSESHRAVTADLDVALSRGDFTMAFQPVVDAVTGRLVQAEGLARWSHPEHGPIPPELFVGLAEESGLMPTLTRWALDTALPACAAWQRTKPGVGVAINLSSSDLQSAAFPDLVAEALQRHAVPAALVTLELTETTLMTDLGSALEVLGRLAEAGVSLAIDDFGTGFCSLSYLRRLPVGFIKIDSSFITEMLDHAEDMAIVSMVVALAGTLGLRTVAEGVQDELTAGRLVEYGVDLLQGAGIAEPMTAAAFEAWERRAFLPLSDPAHATCDESARSQTSMHDRAVMHDEPRPPEEQLDLTQAVDPLTGLANRKGALRILDSMGSSDAVIVIDLDQLALLDTEFGDIADDYVVRSFARTLQRVSRDADTVARTRRTEFVWLLPGTSPDKARNALRRLRTAWAPGRPLVAAFSAGVTTVGENGAAATLALARQASSAAGRPSAEIVPVN